MRSLFTAHGFEVLKVGPIRNWYSVRYLVRLLPLPAGPKRAALAWLQDSFIGRLRLRVPLGNLYVIGQKPAKP
jgi:hypothetical protein